jgi:FAD/FMN-containing dehydrogenase
MITVSNVFSSVPPLFAKLAKILVGDIDCSYGALKEHSMDGSPYAIQPQAVIYPKTSSDIKHAVAFAREYGIPLTVCGGRTAGTGGSLGEGIAIDMTRYFSHIRHVNMMEHTVSVDAGARIDELREKLSGWNMEIPLLEKEYGNATIGGLVATKSATASTFYAGSIREWVEGLTVIVDSGEEHHIRDATTPSGRLLGIYQSVFPLLSECGPVLRAARRECSDDATGYSLWNTSIGPRQLIDQLVGSEGTLAVITSVTLRVADKKKCSASYILPLQNAQLLQTAADIATHHMATRLFMFDDAFRKLTDSVYPGMFPHEFEESAYALCVTFRDNDEHALHLNVKSFLRTLSDHTGSEREIAEDAASKLMSPSFLHSLFKQYSKGAYMISTFGEGIIVPRKSYAACLNAIDQALSRTGRMYTLSGYAGSGHIAVTAAFDPRSLSYEHDIQEYRECLLSSLQGFDAGLSASAGDGLERTAMLPAIFNEATRSVFKRLKDCWDPHNIFNPSKKIAVSKEYLAKHVTHSLD